jgi:DNA-binding transcriptional LysR family regulator
MIMDRLDTISIFVAVAELGSFVAAARRLRRSPAAVTRAVAQLEARLGVRLLNRTTRAVGLSEAGQRFLAGAKRALMEFQEIEQAASGQRAAPSGQLQVTAPIVFGRLHVLPIVCEFLERFPAVSVRMVLLDRLVDLVDEGIDVAVRIGGVSDSSTIAIRVGDVRRVVVASPSYLKGRRTPRRAKDLASLSVINFAGLGSGRWSFRGPDGASSIDLSPRLDVNMAEAALDAARAGLGVTRVLSYQAVEQIRSGELKPLLPVYEGEQLPVHIMYPGGLYPAAKLRAFIDFAAPRLRARLKTFGQH